MKTIKLQLMLALGVLLAIMLAATIAGWHFAKVDAERSAQERFKFRADEIRTAIANRMNAYEQVLRGGVALFHASNAVTRTDWRVYVENLKIEENYPGIQGMGFSKYIPPAELAMHIRQIRAEGFPEYVVKPAGERPEYTAIIFLEPFNQRNQRAFGFDMFSEPTRRAAMEQARDSGNTAVSGKVKLVQETKTDVQAGFLMYLPVYRYGKPLGDVEQRRAALLGYVYSPFRMGNLMQGILGDRPADVELQIYDGANVSETGRMHGTDPENSKRAHLFNLKQSVSVNGRPWLLQISSLPNFEATVDRQKPLFVLLFGLAISGLTVLLAWAWLSTRTRAQNLAQEMTQAMREREERLRSIVDTAVDGIIVINQYGIVESFNESAEKIFGYSPAEVLGRNINMLMPEPFRSAHDSYLQHYTQTNEAKIIGIGREVMGLRKDGSTFPLDLAVGEMKVQEGVRMFTGIVRDISDRVAAKNQLREQEKFASDMIENLTVPTFIIDSQHRVLKWNKACEELTGVKAAEVVGTTEAWRGFYDHARPCLADLVVDGATGTGSQLYQQYEPSKFLSNGVHAESWFPDMGGKRRYVIFDAAPLFDELGKMVAAIESLQDITERKEAEDALREAGAIIQEKEAFQRSIIDNLPVAVFCKDARDNFRFTLWNNKSVEMFGLEKEQAIGSNDYDWFPREQADFFLEKDSEVIESGMVVEIAEEFVDSKHLGRISVHTVKVPVPDVDGKPRFLLGISENITQRKQAEELLRNTLSLQHAILNSANYSIISTDVNGIIRTFNSGAERMLGYSSAELVDKLTPAILHLPEEVVARAATLSSELGRVIEPGFEVFVAKAREGGADENVWTYVRKDGGQFPVVLSVTALQDEQGVVSGFLGVAYDITERKKAEEALRDSEGRYRLLAEYASDMIARLSPAGLIDYVSPASASVLGYEPNELLGRSLFEFIHPDDLERVRHVFQNVLENYLLDTVTYRVLNREGKHIWLESSLRGLRESASAKAQQIITVSRDVTDRVRTAKNLDQFKNILDNTLDMIFMFEPDTLRFVYLNRGAVEGMGYTREELLSMTPYQIKSLMPEPKFREFIAPLLSGEKPSLSFETLYRRKDGSDFPAEVFLQLVRAKDEKGLFVAIVRDITERKKIDRLKNEFVSTVSHELRTPLTSIRGSLGLIMGGVAGEMAPQAKSLIDIAYKNSERLVRLINDILDVEKIESGKIQFEMKPLELMPIILQALESNRAYGEQFGVRFEITAALEQARVNVDVDRMIQVMSNLLSNAAKFSPPNAQVDIAVTQDNGFVRVSVSDHGAGVPDEFHDKIFQKFSQADSSDTRAKGGTGLGLSISKAIVEKMGGEIGFESMPGVGTTFYFKLPEWREGSASLVRSHAPLAIAHPSVLICEDDADVAHLIDIMLKRGGFDTEMAGSVREARERLQTHAYAAMTLDLGLPDGDGIELIRELRGNEATRHLPIVVVSGRSVDDQAQLSGSFAVIDWLGKPIDNEELVTAVQRAVHSFGGYRPRILHIEDDPDIRHIVASMTSNIADYYHADTLQEASAILSLERYNLVILDINLPDGSGWDLLPQLKTLTPSPAVLVFSASDVPQEQARKVAAALVKSQTSDRELLDTIGALVRQNIARPA